MENDKIKNFFEPRSVAIVGASHNPDKVGYKILKNIIDGGYKGEILLVNPKGGEILGLPVYKNLSEIKKEIDLAIMAIPAEKVFEEINQWMGEKVKFLIIVSSGFSEIGNSGEEKKIVDLAKEKGIRILGPNVFGVYSAKSSLNATFGAKVAKSGNVAILSQSGALGIALMGKTQTEGMGLSAIVFEGNKADLNEKDFLPYFSTDEQTKAIFMYLEGVKNGAELIKNLRETTKKKPVVVLKAGVTPKGIIASASHTGSLAVEEKVFEGAMQQTGAIMAENLQQAIDWIKFLSQSALPKGENTLIITNGGGMGILATDACEKKKIKLFEEISVLQKDFSSCVRGFGSFKNPIDITGGATAQDYQKALEIALNGKDYHAVICLGCETAVLDNKELGKVFLEMNQKYQKAGKPLVFAFVGGSEVEEELLSLKKKGLAIFSETQEAVSCLGVLYQHYFNLKRKEKQREKVRDLRIWGGVGVKRRNFATAMGIVLPKAKVARSKNEVLIFAKEIGFPVAMKIVSKDIIHKTDAGGVILDLRGEEEILAAYDKIIASCRKYNPKAEIEGVEIAQMVGGGVEMIVGAKKDRDFGTVVMVGLGGIYAEVFKDIVFRVCPLSLQEAEEMIKQLKAFGILKGVRGEKEKDIKAVAEIILKLGAVVDANPNISEIEINPLKVFEKGAIVLDLRVITA